jgi:hypothetical protein
MTQRHLLYLSAQQLSAFPWKGGRLGVQTSFPATTEGLAAFHEYLQSRQDHLFYLLLNIADEGFQFETIPFLQGRDREVVLKRKLGQYFFATNLSLALRLGFDKGRRKDERLLLAGFTNAQAISPWISVLQSLDVVLAGIYSQALLGSRLLKKLKVADGPCLLLTLQDHSLRQSFYDEGELHFSRLSPLHDSSIGGISQALATEAAKMHQYLVSQRQIARGQPLKALALVHPQAAKSVAAASAGNPAIELQVLTTDEAARAIGLNAGLADSRSEVLFLHLLATQPPPQQFADRELRHNYRIWQLKKALSSGGLLVLLACLLFAGKHFYDASRLQEQTAQIQAEAAQASQRYNDVARTFPPLPLDNETLRQVINRYQTLEQQSGTPLDLYRALSRGLEAAPQVDVDAIAWQRGALPGTPVAAGNNLPGDESALVKGAIPTGPQTNPRQVLALFERFLTALRRDPQLQVTVQQQPFDVESGKALKGGSGESTPARPEPRPFAILITRRVAP